MMRAGSKRFVAGLALVVSGLALPGRAVAQTASSGAPDASAADDRSWLAQRPHVASASASASSGGASPWGSLAALVLVAGVGGAALIMRKRRRSTALPPSMAVVNVVSGTRVGPKAQVVIVEVAGKPLLLGVTDTTVSSLGWLDGIVPIDAPAKDTGDIGTLESATRTLKVLDPVEVDEPQGNDARFRAVLDRALGKGGDEAPFVGNPGVAALIAARTEDVVRPAVTRRKRRAPAAADADVIVPDQVAGLLRKQRGA